MFNLNPDCRFPIDCYRCPPFLSLCHSRASNSRAKRLEYLDLLSYLQFTNLSNYENCITNYEYYIE